MRRTFAISDWFFMLSHRFKRNRVAVLIYALLCLLFLVIGIAIGVNISDKAGYALKNGAVIFAFLRGERSAFTYFLIDALLTLLYALFAASMFFFKVMPFLSVAPCLYKAYSLGMQSSIIIIVYSASSLPMLFVLFIPAHVVSIIVLCILSRKCFEFSAINGRCSPSRADIAAYYKSLIPYALIIIACSLVTTVTVTLFGSALIGVI